MRSVLTFLSIVALAITAAPAAALDWSPVQATQGSVETIDVDDRGRGVYVTSATTLVPVAADGTSGTPITYGEATAPIAIDVSDTGRLAVLAKLGDGGLGLGVGTTTAPPSELAPFASALGGQTIDGGYRVAVGRDGRILGAWSQQGETGSAVVTARLAPGASAPNVATLDSYDASEGGYPYSFAVVAAALDNGARSAVAFERSGPTGPTGLVRRTATPEGPFGEGQVGISAGRFTAEPLTILEGTGFTSLFAFGFNASNGPDAVFGRRLSPAGKVTPHVTLARLTGLGRWSADIGANGSGAIVSTGGGRLKVRTRTEAGVWDTKAQTLRRVGPKRRRPAVSVSKLGRKVVAYPLGGQVVAAFAKPGARFGKLAPIPGSNGCDTVSLTGAASGRTVAVLGCDDRVRLATVDAG